MFLIKGIYNFVVDSIQTILLAAAFFVTIYIFFFRPFQVSGQSMFPTFHDKEYVLTSLIGYEEFLSFKWKFAKPKRGTVIVFKAPVDPNKEFIKRIIGIPGDKVSIKDGKISVNGTQIDESKYLVSSIYTNGGAFILEGKEVLVPENSYLVIGDNRGNSSDSREWGFITKDEIIGESFFVYWPWDRMRRIVSPESY